MPIFSPTRRRLSFSFVAASLFAMNLSAFAADITLKYWTWHPEPKVYEPAIKRFEELNPGVKVELTSMDSKSLQEKVPLALTTGEDVDVVGVQPHMGMTIRNHLLDLEPLLNKVDANWKSKYNQKDAAISMQTTGGVLKYITLVRYGSMMGYYNVDLFKKYGLNVPKTIEDYKKIAEVLKAKEPGILPAAINGKDAWTMNEMLYTVMGQTSDYYNKFVYDDATLNAPQVSGALRGLKKFFDLGIFSKDTLDFDYGRSQEMFTSGKAATYFQGTWEGWLLSSQMRADKKVGIGDVGAFALPVVQAGGKPALNSYIEVGTAIAKQSKNPEAAAKFIAFLQFGEGTDILAKAMVGTFGKIGMKPSAELFSTPGGKAGVETMNSLVGNPAADRYATPAVQSFSGFDVAVSDVIQGKATPEAAAQQLEESWVSHSRKTNRKK